MAGWADLAGSLIGFTGGLIMNNQNVKNAQAQAEATQQALDKQREIALINQQTVAMQNQANKPQVTDTNTKSNLPLYIGLGVGGVLILGLVVYAVTRK
jgi:hypothetical protein